MLLSKCGLANLHCPPQQFSCLSPLTLFSAKHPQVVERLGDLPVMDSKRLLPNSERSFEQGCSLLWPPLCIVQQTQIVEGGGDVWMLRPKRLLANCQRTLEERQSLAILSLM